MLRQAVLVVLVRSDRDKHTHNIHSFCDKRTQTNSCHGVPLSGRQVLYPINGVWFCLGFCIFILLPSIILSFKLVTLYRKLDSYDESPYEYADPIYDAYRPSDYHDFGDQPREMLIQVCKATDDLSRRMYALFR